MQTFEERFNLVAEAVFRGVRNRSFRVNPTVRRVANLDNYSPKNGKTTEANSDSQSLGAL